jgi:hypothetical protein
MKARLFRSKRQGQSIILIALIIVVLVAMVGLSVDVGNTYAQNRNAVRATNAAALAGMDKLIKRAGDDEIGAAIVASFKSNGITAQIDPAKVAGPGERQILAYYLDSNGNQLGSCTIGGCGGVPANVTYIQIKTTGTVDTYFARVVGQQTLPVKAQAFAAQCTPVNGVYPIAMNAADINTTQGKFINPNDGTPYGIYNDDTYKNKTYLRIYRKTNFGDPGSFSWLQWTTAGSGGSAVSTEQMLSGDGNLDTGFQEVTPWPDPNKPAPQGYPLLPGQLSVGDWIKGNTGNTNSSAIRAALDYHIANRTVMNLPVIDQSLGNGANTSFHYAFMGSFLLTGYNLSGSPTSNYFDFVYLGQAQNEACLNTNVNQGLKGLGMNGQVYVNPRWKVSQPPAQPVAYNIVLDVSGSMSWDFNGYGTYDGTNNSNNYNSSTSIKGDVQCESPNNPNPSGLLYTDRCLGGQNSAWKNENERRIYVAKNAIFNFINRMNQYDTMRVIAFSSGQSGNATASSAWSSDKTTLKNTVICAGAYPAYSSCTSPSITSATYKTNGGTSGPQALDKAAKMFLASNGYTPTAGNGQSFKPVVIYLTDGVANIFLDGSTNYARDICSNMSSAQAINTADPCQIGTTSSNVLRPISAMIDIANNMKASMSNLEIYAVGLAQAPSTGLPKVANDSSYYFSASQAGFVDTIMTNIQARATGATCTAGGGYSWLNTIDSAHTPASPPAPGNGVFGQVYIYDVNSATPKYTLPIAHDTSVDASGLLGFSIAPPDPNNPASTGITPGTYEMEAYIDYKGDDGVTRQYDRFINQGSLTEARRITFSVTSAGTLGSSVPIPPIFLDLASSTTVCPTTP